ncbi:TPR domain-containing protein [Oceaniovalibus guishaninsula JLT2003]|uniref:TPR domain-containing protein n=1 Tax=Oceaniovalibus guishaninsula JLT2003 TaxID=1231392 RepID=K2HG94_9RHOB|nr:tetratricopeptide repeat protein [Oceaniovalibus guishaninsula]EKE45482.1 TPR domain-containing protein [Oceaniovalibus guishaninsula JLT2003]
MTLRNTALCAALWLASAPFLHAASFDLAPLTPPAGGPSDGALTAGRDAQMAAVALRDRALLPDATPLAGPPGQAHALQALGAAAAGQTDMAEALLSEADPFLPETAIARALIARNAGDLAGAEAAIGDALRIAPRHAYAANVMGSIALARGDAERAADAFSAAVAAAPEGATYWNNLAVSELALGQMSDAQRAINAAIALAPRNCVYRMTEARIADAARDSARAAKALDICLAAEPGNVEAARQSVIQARDGGDLDRATMLLDRHGAAIADRAILATDIALRQADIAGARAMLEGDSAASQGRAALMAAVTVAEGGDIAGAIAALDADSTTARTLQAALAVASGAEPLATDLPSVDALYSGLATGDAGRLAQAGPAFGIDLSGLGTAPEPQTARDLALPLWLWLAGYADLADEGLAIIADNGDDAFAAFAAFAAARDAGRPVSHQREWLREAARRDPGFAAPALALAESHLAEGALAEALPWLEQAAAIRPDATLLLRTGLVAETLGDDKTAERHYRKAAESAPDNHATLNQLAWFLAERGQRLDEARSLADRAADLAPGNAAILDTLGWIDWQEGHKTASLERLRQADTLRQGRDPDIRLRLATVLAADGQEDAASDLLTALARDVPAFRPDAIAALRAEIAGR